MGNSHSQNWYIVHSRKFPLAKLVWNLILSICRSLRFRFPPKMKWRLYASIIWFDRNILNCRNGFHLRTCTWTGNIIDRLKYFVFSIGCCGINEFSPKKKKISFILLTTGVASGIGNNQEYVIHAILHLIPFDSSGFEKYPLSLIVLAHKQRN